ncbi:MAG: fibronectin type III domain-containing protein [Chloroflexota bacterium]|nr:fibronectin type III domain-containing protein [Chloroflexota bacterium]
MSTFLRRRPAPRFAAFFLVGAAALIAATLILSGADHASARTAGPRLIDLPLTANAEEQASPAVPPDRPDGLTVETEIGSLDVSLNWDDVDGADGYLVRWREAGSGAELNAGTPTAASEAQISVDDYGQWVVRVQACNDAGCGKPQTKKFRVKPAPQASATATAEDTPVPATQPVSEPGMRVSIFASPASPEVNQSASLSWSIANIPSDAGAPSYDWQIERNGVWDSVWNGPSFSHSSNSPTSITFRLTVSYQSGDSDTSDPLTVTWTGDPPPVLVLEPPTPECELAPPEAFSALSVVRGAVAFWEAPSDENACEPIGYRVSARNLNGGDWVSETVGPEARSHLLDDLTPGTIEYQVTTIYPRGPSTPPLALPQSIVPSACDITLTVAADLDRGVSGTWANVARMPVGCKFGLEVEYEYKQSTWDHFRNYGRFRNHLRVNPNQPSFIAYGLEPGVTYDFRIVAVDAAGRRNESNVASVTVVYDADATPDEHSPTGLRVQPDNDSAAYVSWTAPESLATGHTLSGYVVEWSFGFSTTTANVAADATSHRISGLTDGRTYTVRVAARTTDASNNTHDAWTTSSPPFTAWSEPAQVWFTSTVGLQTPLFNQSRIFMITDGNKKVDWGLVQCRQGPAGSHTLEIGCPYGALVGFNVSSDENVAAVSTSTAGVETQSSQHFSAFRGPSAVLAHASGGNAKLLIEWEGLTGATHLGSHDAWVVQHRRQNADGTWPDWPTGHVITETDTRSHTFTGLTNGTWQVHVRARSARSEDHDDDSSTPNETVHRLGFNSETRTVTLSAANHAVPGRVTGGTVTPGPGSLIAGWEPPSARGAIVHAYQVRHRIYDEEASSDSTGWTEGPVIYPRLTRRLCDATASPVCANPRSYEITGLVGGNRYDVAVRGKNANGWGEWQYIGIRNVADGFTPVLESAAINGASLTLTFDRTIDTDSVPDGDAFTVTVVGWPPQTPSAVAISGKTVTLTMPTAVGNIETVTIRYDRPDENPLQHNDAPVLNFSGRSVTNNTP